MTEPVIVPRAEHPISRRDIDADALKVLYRLHESGYAAYLVGGSVRDLLMNRTPKDFDITTDARGTTLHFTHQGLTAEESACFEACSRGWTFYITKSLPQLIASGTGQPFPKYTG